jgi:hypothetical protein
MANQQQDGDDCVSIVSAVPLASMWAMVAPGQTSLADE